MEQAVAKILATSPEAWRDTLTNDFEKTVFEKYPAIRMIKDELYNFGAIYASMSGSGSTVFALFRDDPHLDEINDVPVLWKGFLP
jgi:4-diphosphocytidyl-2-C-methyl-D-erythritol kinase